MKGSAWPLAVQLRGKGKGGLPGRCMAPGDSRRVRCLQQRHPAFPSGLLQVSVGQAAAGARLWMCEALTLAACQTQHQVEGAGYAPRGVLAFLFISKAPC